MNGKVLATWLQKLQDEFVNRMAAIDADAAAAAMEDSEGDEDVEMEERVQEYDGGGWVDSGITSEIGGGNIEEDESRENRDGSSEHRYEMTGALQSETEEEN